MTSLLRSGGGGGGGYSDSSDATDLGSWAAAKRLVRLCDSGAAGSLAGPARGDDNAAMQDPSAVQQGRDRHPPFQVRADHGDSEEDLSRKDMYAYSRDLLLKVGVALGHAPASASHDDALQISMDSRPEDTPRNRPEEAIAKLVEISGGRVKIGNLAAAGLALGIMSGCHSKVCQDILATVRARPDIFVPVPRGVTTDINKLTIGLARLSE
mmetsp:Transcript_68306/g.192611  ORF Transcript_68306/g.192611 Transcript_68306/m.192611 type:complete len:211 (-) Transcript_68306:142-774(-)